MIFTFFISIVFIAELIIFGFICINLLKLDKNINETNNFITELNPKISEIMILLKEISREILDFAPIIADKIIEIRNSIIIELIERIVYSFLFLGVNLKIANKIKKSHLKKMAFMGLKLLR